MRLFTGSITAYPDVIVDDRLLAGEARQCVVRNLKDDGDGFMEYVQVIKVVDDEAPVLECAQCWKTSASQRLWRSNGGVQSGQQCVGQLHLTGGYGLIVTA